VDGGPGDSLAAGADVADGADVAAGFEVVRMIDVVGEIGVLDVVEALPQPASRAITTVPSTMSRGARTRLSILDPAS
jgi:hypothetical protein